MANHIIFAAMRLQDYVWIWSIRPETEMDTCPQAVL